MNPGGPGWNDPPSLSYEIHSQTAARRNLLTKRVGLPDLKLPEASPAGTETSGPLNAPPTSTGCLPPPASTPPKCATSTPPLSSTLPPSSGGDGPKEKIKPVTVMPTIFNPIGDGEKKDMETKKILQEEEFDTASTDIIKDLKTVIERCIESNIITKQVSGTIAKKLDILEQQLETGKLPDIVRDKMQKLTSCLLNKKYDSAWDIHVSLMCDHSSSVLQWMVGVKRLISEARKLPN